MVALTPGGSVYLVGLRSKGGRVGGRDGWKLYSHSGLVVFGFRDDRDGMLRTRAEQTRACGKGLLVPLTVREVQRDRVVPFRVLSVSMLKKQRRKRNTPQGKENKKKKRKKKREKEDGHLVWRIAECT